MRVELFDFELPEERIALRPASPREAAKLLVIKPGTRQELADQVIADLPDLLNPGDLLIFNDTRVIPARLFGTRRREGAAGEGTASIEVLLHRRIDGSTWQALAKPAKRLKPGDRIVFGHKGEVCLQGSLAAEVTEKGEEGEVTLVFDFHGVVLDEAIAALGDMPLPPYIASKRPTDEADVTDYQTIYARRPGAVAAPTAGLHFTEKLQKKLATRGVSSVFVTLHVGAGTFLPVKANDTDDHRMHAEWGEVTNDVAETIARTREAGGRVVAVGTTALRLLEAAAASGEVRPYCGETDIFITPGYRFMAVDMLLTNFHLPRSTLFMLVCAFAGLEAMKRAYLHAVSGNYRFYSYGDACLISRADGA